jgi:Protein of unknown function (DUF2948)
VTSALKLLAEDAADLDIVSAAAQDALVRVGDLAFDRRARRFAMRLNRFRWECANAHGPYERVECALSFEGVLAVKSRNVRRESPDALVQILSINFSPDPEPPGGAVRMMLAGGGEIALEVECLDAVLADLGAPWRTQRRPEHEEDAP